MTWKAEGPLPNGGVRVRHVETRALFECWPQDGEIHVVLRQGAAGSKLFEEVKDWYRTFGKQQPDLL